MAPDPPNSPTELIRFIEAAGENVNVDAKAAMEWDGGKHSASLAKDIMAFANSRDGGVIVIGKTEKDDNQFELTGATPEQAATFETTKVATWINNHCEPPVHLICSTVEHEERLFVVITVSEFHDIPVMCTKDFQDNGSSKMLLKKGAIYARTPNAASAPLETPDDLRNLIGIATMKRSDEFIVTLQKMMSGQPLVPPPSTAELYEGEREDLRVLLEQEVDTSFETGGFTFVFHPDNYREDRWDNDHLMQILKKTSVSLTGNTFPCGTRDVQYQQDGLVGNELSERVFGLNRSGLFMYCSLFREN
ncbi:hypothetical protein LCGC14_3122770, partial [marine sediment metagenome]